MVLFIIRYLLAPLLKVFITKESGFGNIPSRGPAILIANHASYIDGPLILALTAWHKNRYVIAIQSREWLERGMLGWLKKLVFVTLLAQIPTNGSVQKAQQAIADRELLQLFPEGSRTRTGKIQKVTRTGLGVLALTTRAPVVPIGIRGTWEFWNPFKKIPTFKRCIEIRVGKPRRFTGKITKKHCLALQDKMMKEVARLAGQGYPPRTPKPKPRTL